MAENDEASGSEAADTPYVPTGLRRSTFTPPADDAVQAAALSADGAAREGQHEPVSVSMSTPGSALSELPDRPRRKSLADDDLVRKLSSEAAASGATLGAIEELQAQLLLRQEDARQFGEWESGMLAIGTPEALDSIAQAIPEFTGVIPIISPEQSADYLARLQTPAPTDAAVDVQADAPGTSSFRSTSQSAAQSAANVPELASVQYMDPAEYPPPRLEERVDAAPLLEPNLSDHIDFQPPWKREQVPDRSRQLEEQPITDESPVTEKAVAPEEPSAPEEGVASDESSVPDEAPVSDDSSTQSVSSGSEEPLPNWEPLVSPAPMVFPETAVGFEPVAEAPTADDAAAEEGSSEADLAAEIPVVYDLVDPLPSGSIPVAPLPPVSLFDQLLSGDTSESAAEDVASPSALLEVSQSDEPTITSSQPIILPVGETELDDDVDEIDRAFGEPSDTVVTATEPSAAPGEPQASGFGAAPIQPLSTPRVQTGELVLVAEDLPNQPVFGLELSGIEPTPLEHRVGGATRMFWLWFATNASVVSLAFGAALLGLGMSLRQAILAAFIGVAISFLPLGLGTLAGKWSGQPTIVVSRATFGLVGNLVPALLALITRLFWGAVLLWLLAVCTARTLVGASLAGPLNEMQLTLIVVAVGFVLAFLVAFLGYPLFARLQLIISIASAVLILGLFVVTGNTVDVGAALSIGDGPWVLVVTGVVLVFSFIGLLWANGSGDLARYQRPGSSGASASLWASFGATLPAFVLIAYGALLAASNPALLRGFQNIPIDTIAQLLPGWYPVPLIAATVLSLLSAVALSLYSGGFALQAVGVRLERQWAIVVIGVIIFGIAIVMALSDAGFADVFRDLATSIAVPVAAWAGIFAAEMMIRRRHFDTDSLLRPGGIYPSVNWVNFTMLFVASALGFAFTSAAVAWLSWQGYGFVLLGIPLDGPVGASDLGVLVALAIGLLTPLAAGIQAVRRQEGASH